MAAAPCPVCDEAIGYETAFYRVDPEKHNGRKYAHASCLF